MRIEIWKGYHSKEVRALIEQAWRSDDILLILCPPDLQNFDLGDRLQMATRNDERPILGLFTSGTSNGEPKLVLYSKSNIRSSLDVIMSFFDTKKIDSIFCYPQPFHTFGLLLGHILSIEKGWRFITGVGKYSTQFHELWIKENGPGLFTLGTPTHFEDLLSYSEGKEISRSYSCIVGGAKVTTSLWRRLRDVLKIASPSIGYGATEASPGIAQLPPGKEPREDGEIGFPLRNLSLKLDACGGYRFAGPSVCMATVFRDRIEFPETIFIADELREREDGVLIFCGRSDSVLNRGGEKFRLESIEDLLRQALTLEALAFAVPEPRLGAELGLLIRSVDQSSSVLLQVQKTLFDRFQVKFDAQYFQIVDEIPKNVNSKPDRLTALKFIVESIPPEVSL